ncbi:hypothetical protein EFA69_16810 [Rufibacter immobilis]|uniref:Uncharacterized protein n=1 Tax=Rufibacter immobilis TaxID=1348778 RepID=A0A3M9MSR6_9BACT|nr:hypothetical protein [Rufibacter immobilis]RNI27768.1 hypothetical protein EFA69_16810 [Rufibacter immobilis]
MKNVILLFLILGLPYFGKAESCDLPPVAIEFLQAKYVFYGTTGNKTFNKDSTQYLLDVTVKHHLKKTALSPSRLTFVFSTEVSPEFAHLPFFKRGYTSGVSFVIFAHQSTSGLIFFENCSNTESASSFYNIRKELLYELERGNEVELDSIVFSGLTVGNLTSSMTYPVPIGSLDSVLAPMKNFIFKDYQKDHYEPFVLYINELGELEKIIAIRNSKYMSFLYHDIIISTYAPLPNIPTLLQEEVIKALARYRHWKPATFLGKPVKYQAYFQVFLEKDYKVKPSIVH